VVPGVSSALAGPSAAGIPVTHRGVSQGFAVLTARPSETWHATVDALAPKTLTLVFLMALGSRREIATRLLARGWPKETPSAIVLGAHTPRAWVWSGPIAALGEVAPPNDRADLPGLVVVGEVVAIADQIAAQSSEVRLAIA
jgi:siroheme synthase